MEAFFSYRGQVDLLIPESDRVKLVGCRLLFLRTFELARFRAELGQQIFMATLYIRQWKCVNVALYMCVRGLRECLTSGAGS